MYALPLELCKLSPVKTETVCISPIDPLKLSVNSLKVEASNLLETLLIVCETVNPLKLYINSLKMKASGSFKN
jgi:hypothetical protein